MKNRGAGNRANEDASILLGDGLSFTGAVASSPDIPFHSRSAAVLSQVELLRNVCVSSWLANNCRVHPTTTSPLVGM